MLSGHAVYIEIKAELENLCSSAQTLELRGFVHRRLGELALVYSNVVDASVGTDDGDADAAGTVSDSVGPAIPCWAIELTSALGMRMFDVQNDLARMVCGRSATALVIRLRWLFVTVAIFGAAVPVILIFGMHWASGGLGQFALAYERPLWLEVWTCVGMWLCVCVMLLAYSSMQREIAWMALKQVSTLWIIAIAGVFVAALASLYEFGVHRSTWFDLSTYVVCALFFPLIALADALPPKLRLPVLRVLGPFALGATAAVALVLRLPAASDTPGELAWTVMGTDTVTNLQALSYSATVLAVLLAEGVLCAWVFPTELAFITDAVQIADHNTPEPPSAMVSPLDTGQAGHVEGTPTTCTPPAVLAAIAQRLDVVGTELAAMYAAASGAERLQVGERIRIHLHTLQLPYANMPQEGEDSLPSLGAYADASVGTDDVEVDVQFGRLTRRHSTVPEMLNLLESGIASSIMIELAPCHGPCTFDVQNDFSRMVCGRSAAALVIRLRWLFVTVAIFGAAVPVLVFYGMHWASGGLGQFALAYEWPLWLEVWICVGWWLCVCVMLLAYASMQREIAWMALKQVSTLWIIAMTGTFVAALASLFEFGVRRSMWVVLPVSVGNALFFPLLAMVDALPSKLRLLGLRVLGPISLGLAVAVALVLRLPTAKGTPGELVWTVMGVNTVTNLQALTYSATVLAVLLAEGVAKGWVFPTELAFIRTSWHVAECVSSAAVVQGVHAAPAASASVAPHPLAPNSLERGLGASAAASTSVRLRGIMP